MKTAARRHQLEILCADFCDPRNVGSAFRLADAVGASLVLCGVSPVPPNNKINKTARSTVRSVAFKYEPSAVDYLLERRRAGDFLLALELTDESVSLIDYNLPASVRRGERKTILIPGSEASGVAQELLDLVDASVHLPMYGQNSSLNVAVALGTAAYLVVGQLGNENNHSAG
ncbi:RNA methyltransferase [Neolewinella antarctica]|uniref:tRNA G18 (Ribose-2'-O)-methylase SpoU n=1 Tax=Neolewinella antarctica TaxID=442734 RepID=A0ABX0XEP3_9BACT|nr:RNA methyltransferase [Neolewinella antarctica]NJC27258.1 tRNA G18 (ribose-2'-O)-methylase SpoU [Neolewinella antarctica]